MLQVTFWTVLRALEVNIDLRHVNHIRYYNYYYYYYYYYYYIMFILYIYYIYNIYIYYIMFETNSNHDLLKKLYHLNLI